MKLRLAAVVLAVAILAGCGPQADPSTAPSATAEPTASPTPTTEPVPAPDLSDPADWVIGFDSVGPLTIGQPIADARAALPSFTEQAPVEGCRVAFLDSAGYPSLAVAYWPADVVSFIIVRTKSEMPSVDLYATSPKTELGIGIGSTRDEFLAAYPDATASRDEAFFSVFTVAGPTGFLVVTLTDGVVDSITTNTTGDFSYELC